MKSGGGGWDKKRGLEVRRRGIKEDGVRGMQNGVKKSRARNVEKRANNITKGERRWKKNGKLQRNNTAQFDVQGLRNSRKKVRDRDGGKKDVTRWSSKVQKRQGNGQHIRS